MKQLKQTFAPSGRLFYGWYIVASAGGLQMLASLLWMQSYGAYVIFLQQEFGWSKTLVAGAFALTRIESGVLGPLQGYWVDRYGPRAILRIGVVLFGLGFMAFSQVTNLWTFYAAFAVIAVGSSLGGFATVMVAIVNWFDRHRSKAVAFSQVGYAIGGMAVPMVVIALEAFGWRTTAFYSGVLVILLGFADGADGEASAVGLRRSRGWIVARSRCPDHRTREFDGFYCKASHGNLCFLVDQFGPCGGIADGFCGDGSPSPSSDRRSRVFTVDRGANGHSGDGLSIGGSAFGGRVG